MGVDCFRRPGDGRTSPRERIGQFRARLGLGRGRRGAVRARGTHGYIFALTAFADPATGEMRLASGSQDKTLRVWDVTKGGAALRVIPYGDGG